MNSYLQIAQNVFNCKTCPTPCNGTSKLNYQFADDAAFSEYYEQLLITHINRFTPFEATKTEEKGYPDISVRHANGTHFYIEVKVQRSTFMSIENTLPKSGLKPSETVALNLSDLNRYFKLEKEKNIHIFVFWVLLNRPCILENKESKFYYLLASELKPIWQKENDKRKFRRKSGEGDEVNGKHLGVTVNYHFSLNELKVWNNKLT